MYKDTPTRTLTGQLFRRGNFLKTYKLLKLFFNSYFLREIIPKELKTKIFVYYFNKYKSFKDLDRAFWWKLQQINCMFNLKKKKVTYVYGVNGIKRVLLLFKWLKNLILLNYNKKNHTVNLFKPLAHFLLAEKNNKLLNIKLKIYRVKLVEIYK